MTPENVQAKLQENVGKIVKIAFGGQSETVTVISVDADGFLCRALPETENNSEFWLAYKEVESVDSSA